VVLKMHAKRTAGWAALGLLIVGIFGFLGWQRTRLVVAQTELAALRDQAAELPALQAENRRRSNEQVSPAELERLRADHVALGKLRSEIESLGRNSLMPAAPEVARSPMIPAANWKNRGTANPTDAIETLAWAAARHDVDRFAGLLTFDPDTKATLDASFATLPEPVRASYGTAERLVASFAAKDVPGGAFGVTVPSEIGTDSARMRMRFEAADGKVRVVLLSLQATPDGWRLVVPPVFVKKYLRQAQGGPTER
jgi:hypothetical protein